MWIGGVAVHRLVVKAGMAVRGADRMLVVGE